MCDEEWPFFTHRLGPWGRSSREALICLSDCLSGRPLASPGVGRAGLRLKMLGRVFNPVQYPVTPSGSSIGQVDQSCHRWRALLQMEALFVFTRVRRGIRNDRCRKTNE